MVNFMDVTKKLFILILLLLTTTLSFGQRRWFWSENRTTSGATQIDMPYSSDLLLLHQAGIDITEDANGISQWNDLSGNGNHSTQSTDINKPATDVNGNVVFDGTDDYLNAVEVITTETEYTFFVVYESTLADGSGAIVFSYNNTTDNIFLRTDLVGDNDSLFVNTISWDGTAGAAVNNIYSFPYTGGSLLQTVTIEENDSVYVRSNGVQVSSNPHGNFGAISSGDFKIGSSRRGDTGFFNGKIKLIAIYNRKLNISEIHEVEKVINDNLSIYPDPQLQLSYSEDLVLYHLAGYGVTSDANGVNQWDDLSGNDNHSTQTITANKPTLNNTDGSIVFNGTDDYMIMSSNLNEPINTSNEMTSFIVVEPDSNANTGERFIYIIRNNPLYHFVRYQGMGSTDSTVITHRFNNNTANDMVSDTVSNYVNPTLIVSRFKENDELTISYNSNTTNSLATGVIQSSGNYANELGRFGVAGGYLNGKIKLIAIYDRKLTPFETALVKEQIIDYFNLPINTFDINVIDNELVAGWKLDTNNTALGSFVSGSTWNIDSIECTLGTYAGNSDFDLVNVGNGTFFRAEQVTEDFYTLNLESTSINMRAVNTGIPDRITYIQKYRITGMPQGAIGSPSNRSSTSQSSTFYHTSGWMGVINDNSYIGGLAPDVHPYQYNFGAFGFKGTSNGTSWWNVRQNNSGFAAYDYDPDPIIAGVGERVHWTNRTARTDRLMLNGYDAGSAVGNIKYFRYFLMFRGTLDEDEIAYLYRQISKGKIITE
jgi:hypothetical protein